MKRSSQTLLSNSNDGFQECSPPPLSAKHRRLDRSLISTQQRTNGAFRNDETSSGVRRPTKLTRTPKVYFSPFVDIRSIQLLLDQEEKQLLYYTRLDYLKFAKREKARRTIIRLTLKVSAEQANRLRNQQNPISACRVNLFFHRIFARSTVKSDRCIQAGDTAKNLEKRASLNSMASATLSKTKMCEGMIASDSSLGSRLAGQRGPFRQIYAKTA